MPKIRNAKTTWASRHRPIDAVAGGVRRSVETSVVLGERAGSAREEFRLRARRPTRTRKESPS